MQLRRALRSLVVRETLIEQRVVRRGPRRRTSSGLRYAKSLDGLVFVGDGACLSFQVVERFEGVTCSRPSALAVPPVDPIADDPGDLFDRARVAGWTIDPDVAIEREPALVTVCDLLASP